MQKELLKVENLTCWLQKTILLDHLSFSVFKGEMVSMIGLHSAGRSALCRVLTGEAVPYRGRVSLSTSASLHAAGACPVQRIGRTAAIESMTVAEYYTILRADRSSRFLYNPIRSEQNMVSVLAELGMHYISPSARMSRLSMVQMHVLQIARAISTGAVILILDDITRSYSRTDYLYLLQVLKQYSGISIIHLSNEETVLSREAQRVFIIRNNAIAWIMEHDDYSSDALHRCLHVPSVVRPVAVRVASEGEQEIVAADILRWRVKNLNLTFQVRAGERIGILDTQGDMWSLLVESILSGGFQVRIGSDITSSYRKMVRLGLALVTGRDRCSSIFSDLSWRDNLTFQALKKASRFGVLKNRILKHVIGEYEPNLFVKDQNGIAYLNERMLLLYRWIAAQPALIVLANPTMGLSLSDKNRFLKAAGEDRISKTPVILISTDAAECKSLCSRTLILEHGQTRWEM